MLSVQIVVLANVLLLQGFTTVLGQFNSFNVDYPDYFELQRQQAQAQFQQAQLQQAQLQQAQLQQFQQAQGQQFQQPQGQQFPQPQGQQFQQPQGQQFQQAQGQQAQQAFGNQQSGNPTNVINDGNPRTTQANSATTPPTTTTPQPAQVTQCRQNCPITSEYNPVCGTDGQNYNNANVLRCARSCGINVALRRVGPCAPRAI